MAKVLLQAVSLSQLSDGYVGKVLDAALEEVVADLIQRGHDGQRRGLALKLTFEPDESGRVSIRVSAKVTKPDIAPPKTVARLDPHAGGLVFNPDLAENPDQKTVNDVIDPAAAE